MQVSDIMTRPVVSVTPDTTIADAARLMLQQRISGLPVVDQHNAVIGVVTEGDLLRRAETGTERRHRRWLEFVLGPGRLADEYVNAHARKVGEVMSEDPVTVRLHDPVTEIVRLMERKRIKRLPVVENGELVGIVSRANLVSALVSALAQQPPAAQGGDAQIRERILNAIANQPWGPRFSVDVAVKDGVVELNGTIADERERTALQVVAENIPGVMAVKDHLAWVEPSSGFVIPAAE